MSSALPQEKVNHDGLCSKGSIHISIQDQLTAEIDKLRLLCFHTSKSSLTSRDEFDERSKHITIQLDNTIVAYGRLTPGPNSVFESWTYKKAQIPTGKEVIDLGRCLVHPDYRGKKLFEAICLKGMQYAFEHGYKYVVGTYIPGHYVGPRLHKLGFRDSGPPVYEDEPGEENVLIQPVVYHVSEESSDWQELINQQLGKFAKSKNRLTAEEQPLGYIRKAILKDQFHISDLRIHSFQSAKEFSVLKPDALKWGEEDEKRTVLVACNQEGEILSTMRGSILHGLQEAEEKLECRIDTPTLTFPALYLDRAATHSDFKNSGLNSVLRYYFLNAAIRHQIPTIMGQIYEGAPRSSLMQRLGYEFYPVTDDHTSHLIQKKPLLLAVLQQEKFITAQQMLAEENAHFLKKYQWHGVPLQFKHFK